MKSNGYLEVYEYGLPKLSGMSPVPVSYARGDVLKVAIEYDANLKKNVVRWYRNSAILYTSTSPTITYPLVVDSSIYSPGSWLHEAHLCSGTAGSGDRGVQEGHLLEVEVVDREAICPTLMLEDQDSCSGLVVAAGIAAAGEMAAALDEPGMAAPAF